MHGLTGNEYTFIRLYDTLSENLPLRGANFKIGLDRPLREVIGRDVEQASLLFKLLLDLGLYMQR